MKRIKHILVLACIAVAPAYSQYAPAVGEEGSTAIHKDSSVFIGWAIKCEIERGYVKLSDTTFTFDGSNIATHGNDTNTLAQADGKVVSLGDRGTATLSFEFPIINGEGADFAVFENSFRSQEPPQNYFLEFAFVEVSSDGERFVRFPSISESQTSTQIATFGQLEPVKIHNLAGKYVVNYGVPFDLEELKDSTEIDLQNITHVKLIDVVGSINPDYASYDSKGNIINDPYPTPFATGGFDLDAVGVIHSNNSQTNIKENKLPTKVNFFPNPYKNGQQLSLRINNKNETDNMFTLKLYSISGKMLFNKSIINTDEIDFSLPSLKKGIYLIEIPELNSIHKIIVTE